MKKTIANFLFSLFTLPAVAQGAVQHVIVIFNENRSFDQFFATFQNTVSTLPGYGSMPVGQCSNSAASNKLGGCYSNSDCGATPNACLRGSALEYPNFQAKEGKTVFSVPHNPWNGLDIDCNHYYGNAVTDIDHGAMDKFATGCSTVSPAGIASAFVYYNHSDFCSYAGGSLSGGQCSLPTLWNYALNGTLMDHFFASNLGPSYPSHLYLWTGQSNEAANNPASRWNCSNPLVAGSPTPSSTVPGWYTTSVGSVAISGSPTGLLGGTYYRGGQCTAGANIHAACICTGTVGKCTDDTDCGSGGTCTIASSTAGCVGGSKGCVCPDVTTIADMADSAGVTWHYYAPSSTRAGGFEWNAPSYIQHLYFGADWTKNVSPAGTSSTDISKFESAVSQCLPSSNCSSLANLVWVQTDQPQNGHPKPKTNAVGSGQSWTTSVIQTIQNNSYVYNHSIILVAYDDWGGFYDHIPPPTIDNLGWGPRVAAFCYGPFCQNGVSHANYEFASILQCMENPPGGTWNGTAWSSPPWNLSPLGGAGTVITAGTTVNYSSGSLFEISSPGTGTGWTGMPITINGVTYTIASVANTTQLTLTESAGTQSTPVPYFTSQRDANPNVTNICTPPSTTLSTCGGSQPCEWMSGGVINPSALGGP